MILQLIWYVAFSGLKVRLQIIEDLLIAVGQKGHSRASPSRSASASDAVRVTLNFCRAVVVENIRHIWNVQPSSRNVGAAAQQPRAPTSFSPQQL